MFRLVFYMDQLVKDGTFSISLDMTYISAYFKRSQLETHEANKVNKLATVT